MSRRLRGLGLLLSFGFILGATGCQQFLDTFNPQPADMSGADMTVTDFGPEQQIISGQVCVLTDVRDYRSCSKQPVGELRVTIEETGAFSILDSENLFLLGTPKLMDHVTLVTSDTKGAYRPTVSIVRLATLGAGNLAVPVLPTSVELTMTSTHGFASDPTRGAIFGWAVNSLAVPQTGVRGASITGAYGPYYDGVQSGEIDSQGPTRSGGLVAFFNLPPKLARITLTPQAGVLAADQFEVPVRAGAITFSLMPLPPQQ